MNLEIARTPRKSSPASFRNLTTLGIVALCLDANSLADILPLAQQSTQSLSAGLAHTSLITVEEEELRVTHRQDVLRVRHPQAMGEARACVCACLHFSQTSFHIYHPFTATALVATAGEHLGQQGEKGNSASIYKSCDDDISSVLLDVQGTLHTVWLAAQEGWCSHSIPLSVLAWGRRAK